MLAPGARRPRPYPLHLPHLPSTHAPTPSPSSQPAHPAADAKPRRRTLPGSIPLASATAGTPSRLGRDSQCGHSKTLSVTSATEAPLSWSVAGSAASGSSTPSRRSEAAAPCTPADKQLPLSQQLARTRSANARTPPASWVVEDIASSACSTPTATSPEPAQVQPCTALVPAPACTNALAAFRPPLSPLRLTACAAAVPSSLQCQDEKPSPVEVRSLGPAAYVHLPGRRCVCPPCRWCSDSTMP